MALTTKTPIVVGLILLPMIPPSLWIPLRLGIEEDAVIANRKNTRQLGAQLERVQRQTQGATQTRMRGGLPPASQGLRAARRAEPESAVAAARQAGPGPRVADKDLQRVHRRF